MVCFSSEWSKKGREENGAEFCDIQIQLDPVLIFTILERAWED